MADAEKEALKATVDLQLRTWRESPATRATFVARALLGHCFASVNVEGAADTRFLTGVAELAAAIAEDDGYYVAFAEACRRLHEQTAEAGLREPAQVSTAPALLKRLGARQFSSSGTPRPSTVLALAHFMGGVPGLQESELQFVEAAILRARDELFESTGALRDLEGDEYEAALDALEFQFTMGRYAARELGVRNMWW